MPQAYNSATIENFNTQNRRRKSFHSGGRDQNKFESDRDIGRSGKARHVDN